VCSQDVGTDTIAAHSCVCHGCDFGKLQDADWKQSNFADAVCFVEILCDACLQTALFVASAVVQGAAFLRWNFRLSSEERQNGWWLYGWFTGCCCLGSVAGASAYAVWMAYLYFLYSSRKLEALDTPTLSDLQQTSELRVDRYRYVAAFHVLFPIEVAFVTVAYLLVLHRMQQFSLIGSSRERLKKLWAWAERAFLAIVVVSNVVGIISNIIASVSFARTAALDSHAASSFAANDTTAGTAYEKLSRQTASSSLKIAAFQGLLECFVLLVTVAAFLIVGVRSHRIIGSALHALFTAQKRLDLAVGRDRHVRQLVAEASLQGKQLQRKVVGTVAFVFFTVLVRSAFRLLFSFATVFQDAENTCAAAECDPCKNHYTHLLYWLLYTPALQQGVVLISSPVTQLVALWGMSGVGAMLQQMPAEELEEARKHAKTNVIK
jgi:hypothetical protein